MIPEIDIWHVANLMLKRYGDEADIESAIRAEELAEAGDWPGEAVWAPDYRCNHAASGQNLTFEPLPERSTVFSVEE
jgi:hypothetical protein